MHVWKLARTNITKTAVTKFWKICGITKFHTTNDTSYATLSRIENSTGWCLEPGYTQSFTIVPVLLFEEKLIRPILPKNTNRQRMGSVNHHTSYLGYMFKTLARLCVYNSSSKALVWIFYIRISSQCVHLNQRGYGALVSSVNIKTDWNGTNLL